MRPEINTRVARLLSPESDYLAAREMIEKDFVPGVREGSFYDFESPENGIKISDIKRGEGTAMRYRTNLSINRSAWAGFGSTYGPDWQKYEEEPKCIGAKRR